MNNEADAADCFQSAFVSALELEHTQTIRNWPALLKRLATARALDRLRQRGRQANRLTPLSESSMVDERAVGPAQVAEATELAEHLRHALADLDHRQAQVFCLASLEDFSYEQIAEQLGVTVNYVGVLLHRARSNLQERLSAHRPTPAGKDI
jgi:RNA polymerase sigma-70 factor (ECF subfamily)